VPPIGMFIGEALESLTTADLPEGMLIGMFVET
jgi:hypothetical protein